jgi:hypothetical protein
MFKEQNFKKKEFFLLQALVFGGNGGYIVANIQK